jgi:hypothetical protein
MRVALTLLVALLMAAPSLAQTVTDANLTVTPVLPPGALSQPTSMAFVADDFGRSRRPPKRAPRLNGALQGTAALDVSVNLSSERGSLGIAVNTATPRAVLFAHGGPHR